MIVVRLDAGGFPETSQGSLRHAGAGGPAAARNANGRADKREKRTEEDWRGHMILRSVTLAAAILMSAGASIAADSTAVEKDGTIWRDADGNPTYKIGDDGIPDYRTWMGYKRYTGNCMPCHGPDGAGSSFAPDLTASLKSIDYEKFAEVVSSGQQNVWHPVNSVMPAWGTDLNVMCYLDDIYAYLRGRSDGKLGRGEPKRPEVDKQAKDDAYACLGF